MTTINKQNINQFKNNNHKFHWKYLFYFRRFVFSTKSHWGNRVLPLRSVVFGSKREPHPNSTQILHPSPHAPTLRWAFSPIAEYRHWLLGFRPIDSSPRISHQHHWRSAHITPPKPSTPPPQLEFQTICNSLCMTLMSITVIEGEARLYESAKCIVGMFTHNYTTILLLRSPSALLWIVHISNGSALSSIRCHI